MTVLIIGAAAYAATLGSAMVLLAGGARQEKRLEEIHGYYEAM